MGRRLILDTNVLIAYERGTIDRAALDTDELAVAAVSIAEYRVDARLIAHARRAGTPRGAHDLIIAAHAVQTDRTVLTFDAKARFADLPGVHATDA